MKSDRPVSNVPPGSDQPERSVGERLRAAHAAAQTIREESLAFIDSDPETTARVGMALLALEPIERFAVAYEPQNDDERTSQMLRVGFTNFLQGAPEMALQGFYQVALAMSGTPTSPANCFPYSASTQTRSSRGGTARSAIELLVGNSHRATF